MMTRAQLAALLGLATLSPVLPFGFDERPVYALARLLAIGSEVDAAARRERGSGS